MGPHRARQCLTGFALTALAGTLLIVVIAQERPITLAAVFGQVTPPHDASVMRGWLADIGNTIPRRNHFVLNPEHPDDETAVYIFTVRPKGTLAAIRGNFASARLGRYSVILCDVSYIDQLTAWTGSDEESLVGFEAWGSFEHVPKFLFAVAIAHEVGHLALHADSDRSPEAENEADRYAWRHVAPMIPDGAPRAHFLLLCLEELAHIARERLLDPGQRPLDFWTDSQTHPSFGYRVARFVHQAMREVGDELGPSSRHEVEDLVAAYAMAHQSAASHRLVLRSYETQDYAARGRTILFANGFVMHGWLQDGDGFVFSPHADPDRWDILQFNGSHDTKPELRPRTVATLGPSPFAVASSGHADGLVLHAGAQSNTVKWVRSSPVHLAPHREFRTLPFAGSDDRVLVAAPHHLLLIDVPSARVLDELVIPGLGAETTIIPPRESARVFVLTPRFLGQSMAVTGGIYAMGEQPSWLWRFAAPVLLLVAGMAAVACHRRRCSTRRCDS